MAELPINYGDTWKVARDKINDSFEALEATVAGYRPHIESWIRWIWDTNTGVKAEWDSIVMKAEDGYIWYKSESNSWTQIIAIADLKWPQGNPWVDGNWITSITTTKVGKTTTVTITETVGTVDTFQIQDGADWVGWDGDVKWPDSSTNWHMAVFDWATWKIIKDWGSIPAWFEPWAWTAGQILRKTNNWYEWDDESAWWVTSVNGETGDVTLSIPTKVSDLTNDSWFITSSDIPTDVSDFNNDAGYLTSSTWVTSVNWNTWPVTVEEVPSWWTEWQVLTQTNNWPAWQNATWWADIVYATQAEYNALPSSKLTDGKHYVIYKSDWWGWWQPWANTVAYYPLTSSSTVNDMKWSGTAYNLTNSWISFWTLWWVDCANTNTAGTYLAWDLWFKLSNGSFTINMYGYKTWYYQVPYIYDFWTHNQYKAIIWQRENSYIRFSFWYGDLDTPSAPANNTWNNLCFTYDLATQTQKIYINWTFITSQSWYSTDLWSTEFKLLSSVDSQSTFYWWLSKFIIEDQVRTAQEIADYYNLTKWDYWIS